jgi:hypothetical protein
LHAGEPRSLEQDVRKGADDLSAIDEESVGAVDPGLQLVLLLRPPDPAQDPLGVSEDPAGLALRRGRSLSEAFAGAGSRPPRPSRAPREAASVSRAGAPVARYQTDRAIVPVRRPARSFSHFARAAASFPSAVGVESVR